MKPKVMSYAEDAEQLWLGVERPGMIRKVFKFVSAELTNSEHLTAGVTIFEPGECSSFHAHDRSEEVNFVLGGDGVLVTEDGEQPFVAGHVIYVPKGLRHQHRNAGTEPLIIGWAYSPPAALPTS